MRRRQGWSMLELMVVIALLGVVTAVAVPRLTGSQKEANNSKARSELQAAHETLQEYYTDNSSWDGLVVGSSVAAAAAVDSDYSWTATATLTPGVNANPSQIKILGPSPTYLPAGTTLILCNAGRDKVYCLGEVGGGALSYSVAADQAKAYANITNSSCKGSSFAQAEDRFRRVVGCS